MVDIFSSILCLISCYAALLLYTDCRIHCVGNLNFIRIGSVGFLMRFERCIKFS